MEYLRVCLAPTLGVGDVLMLDNSSVHTSKLVSCSYCHLRVLHLDDLAILPLPPPSA